MPMDRRGALKVLAVAGASAAGVAALPRDAAAREPKQAPEGAVGMLYDSTLCIGCKACMGACRDANGLTYEDPEGMYYDPVDLSSRAKTVIKVYEDADAKKYCFFKAQCMHCIDPACASACMLGAFSKREGGIVTWDGDRCVGCRYCEVACPFGVPKFEFDQSIPKMVKCEMCAHRLREGRLPACVEVCPRQAIIFGKRDALLAEAKKRIAENPASYFPRVYGETDGGGTQVLFLSPAGIPFSKVGLPDLGDTSVPSLPETVQHTLYAGFAAPIALYAMLAAAVRRNLKRGDHADDSAGAEVTP
ncbi:MAG TPA: hydrogenase 2 operon protein HybA [Longimicrobium sp.]|nr:hydrogenase 2 operon protein HybA [Longimicrobium sp.]